MIIKYLTDSRLPLEYSENSGNVGKFENPIIIHMKNWRTYSNISVDSKYVPSMFGVWNKSATVLYEKYFKFLAFSPDISPNNSKCSSVNTRHSYASKEKNSD